MLPKVYMYPYTQYFPASPELEPLADGQRILDAFAIMQSRLSIFLGYVFLSAKYMFIPDARLRKFDLHEDFWESVLTSPNFGMAIADIIPMITITIISSIRVNPRFMIELLPNEKHRVNWIFRFTGICAQHNISQSLYLNFST